MKLKRILSLVLALALMMSMVSVSALVSFAEEVTAGTYFYSSFEEGEEGQTTLPLLVNKIDDGKKSAGLGMPPVEIKLVNDFTKKVTNVEGNTAYVANEGLANVADNNSGSKYLTNTAFPVNIIYTLSEAQVLGAYSITSANDSQDRDPYTWTVAGSNDKENWVTLDSKDGQVFAERYLKKLYSVENTEAYLYYRLQVTVRYNNATTHNSSGMMQIADWSLGEAIESTEGLDGIITSDNSTGPQGAWNNLSGKGWTGANALKIAGTQIEESAHSWNVIYEDVNVAVNENTNLSYMIYPDYVGSYDYNYTSHYTAVDLKFTDGTYLSDLNAKDQNGDVVSPKGQGEGRALYTKQWNTITSKIGEVAEGKVIDEILVGFEKDGIKYETEEAGILAYIDDIKIEEKEDKVYENALAYTMTRRGTESTSSFSRGLNHPGVLYPNGFNFWTMCSANNGGGGLYMFQEGHDITHISTSHQASYWTGERGTVQFMVNTNIDAAERTAVIGTSIRQSDYNRDTLVDQANYLKIDFNDDTPAEGSTLELVPTDHAASVKFTFDEDVENRNIIFDSVNTNTAYIAFNEDGSFTGYTQHCSNGMRRMHFYGTFSVAPSVKKAFNNGSGADAIVAFPEGTTEVVMNMATSFISADQAKHNLELEIGDKTWDQVYDDTEAAWLDIMNRVEIEGASEEELITFWSSMYRLYMYPNNLSENIGTNEEPKWAYASPYRGANDNPTVVEGYKFYYNNGFWDTYRTTPGAYALLTPTLYTEFLNGFAQHYIDSGWVPRWVAPGGTNSMVGTSSDVFFADAVMRGIDFDKEDAYLSALRNGSAYTSNATNGGRQQTYLSNYVGYVNSSQGEGMSWSMEGYINDAGIAKMAEALGDHDNAVYYENRALNYTKLFNEGVDFFMGRTSSGAWTTSATSFNPKAWGGNYTETNAWNMAFHVPFDGNGLANLYGGREGLEAKLDAFFTEKGDYDPGGYGGEIHEMKEAREAKLGQYGHSNQPSHHIIFMYNYANAPAKAQYYARDVLDRLYVGASIGQGFPGDADNGESSAWYIQTALGIYPVNMGSGNYTLVSPLFDKVTIHQENGSDLEIIANNNSQENVYVQSVTIDGVPYNSTMISHEDFTSAKQIVFEMGNEPSTWGEEDSALDSLTQGNNVAIPMADMTNTNIVNEFPEAKIDAEYVEPAVTNLANAFDNNGSSYITVNGNKASVYTCFATPRVVELYTVSNYTSTTNVPDTVALYASNDGTEWTKLDESDVTYKWSRYVEPFAVENSTAYTYYRLDLSSETAATMNIAELELYGYVYKTTSKEDLLDKINEAKALDPNLYGTPFDALNAAVADAEAIYADENATALDYYNVIGAIDSEISKLELRRNALELIEGESFSSAASGIGLDVNDTASGGYNVGGCQAGFWLRYNYLDFGNGANEFSMHYARQGADTGTTPHVNLYIDAPTEKEGGTLIGTLWPVTTAQSNWTVYTTTTCELNQVVTGVHDVYFMLEGDGAYVANIDYFQFGYTATAILDVAGDLAKIPNSRRTLEITTTAEVEDIVLYDANGNEIETSYVGYTTLEDGNKLFEVDVTIDNTTVGDMDITIGAVTADGESKQDVTLTVLPYATSASTDADEYVVGNEVTITVVADEDVAKIGLVNEYGKFIAKVSESAVSNGDGTNTWTIVTKFDTKGSRTIDIYAAGPNLALNETGLSVDFTVDIAVSEGDEAVAVKSVDAPETAKKNEVITITVTTSTSATKVGIFSENGSALGKLSQTYTDKDGERVWTITLKIGSKGDRELEVKATDATGVWSEAEALNIKIN